MYMYTVFQNWIFLLHYFPVPKPVVNVTTSSYDILYQATQQSLFCNVTFSNFSPPGGSDVEFQWNFQGTLIENDTRITISSPYVTQDLNSTHASSTLTFSPINTTDSGKYTCTVNITVVGCPVNIINTHTFEGIINVYVTGMCSF